MNTTALPSCLPWRPRTARAAIGRRAGSALLFALGSLAASCSQAQGLAGSLSHPGAGAAPAAFTPDAAGLQAFLARQVEAAALRDGFSRFEIQLGSLDALASAPPCPRAEPFLPSSARTWGRTAVGVRCVEGARWSLLVPATVAVWGRAVVASAPLAAGATLGEQDLQEQESELTRDGPAVSREAQPLVGRTLTRAVAAGQALRLDATRAPLTVQAGDMVRIRIGAPGVAITATGQALASASAGQSVRVRTELGRVLTGTAREGRVVDVAL